MILYGIKNFGQSNHSEISPCPKIIPNFWFLMYFQLVHVLLSLLLLLRTFDYGHDDVTLHVINGFLVQMFLSMVACTLDRLVAIKYPYLYERVATKQVNTV